jgi:predicted Zn-dependent protease
MIWLFSEVAFSQQPNTFESLLASAKEAQARSDFQAAAEFYRQALALHPQIPELRANLGLMYYQTGKDEQAAEAFREALRLKPSLFVPNLFLGLDYVKMKQFTEAIPYLKRAEVAKPTDSQVHLALAQAYTGTGKTGLAISSYWRATEIDSQNADAWYHLGVSYLEQVEAGARILLTHFKDSAYLQVLVADTFSEQRAFVQAKEAYQKALSMSTCPQGTHAAYAFVLLNRHDLSAAESELNAELAATPGSLVAKLGLARLHIDQGATEKAAKELDRIWETDAGFLKANAVRFTRGLPQSQRAELQRVLEESHAAGRVSEDVVAVFRSDAGFDASQMQPQTMIPPIRTGAAKASAAKPAKVYASGRYRECADLLASRFQLLQPRDLRLLATCAYSTGDYRKASDAAAKLVSNGGTEAEGLYWETKSAQKLATEALARASELDSGSPRLHVLLGDLYRQRRYFGEAEQEYRKALALQPEDTGALYGLSLALVANLRMDEALRLTQAALRENVDDPELNALMGEILCARRDFSEAEPYLKKALNTKFELAPHVHALLGKVYAEANRTRQAITELKLGLADDKDGSLHYQIARLYLKIGDRDSAKRAFEISHKMHRQGLTRAAVAFQQGKDDSDSQ